MHLVAVPYAYCPLLRAFRLLNAVRARPWDQIYRFLLLNELLVLLWARCVETLQHFVFIRVPNSVYFVIFSLFVFLRVVLHYWRTTPQHWTWSTVLFPLRFTKILRLCWIRDNTVVSALNLGNRLSRGKGRANPLLLRKRDLNLLLNASGLHDQPSGALASYNLKWWNPCRFGAEWNYCATLHSCSI